jgi:hypothetical protein
VTFAVKQWEGVVDGPGLYLGVPEDIYHSDACPEPSLSASVAKIGLQKSMRKARAAHPRLREPDFPEDMDDDETERSPPWYIDVGSAVHSIALGAGQPVVQVRAPNWRKGDAKDMRKALRADRKIPLLTKHYDLAQRMATTLRPVLRDLLGNTWAAEAMACSKDSEYGFWVRSLMDGVSTDLRTIVDVKTTSLDMSPREAGRTVNKNGNTFQSSFYTRNLDNLDPGGMGRRAFCFVFCEVEYPHETAIVHPDEALKTMGDMQVSAACKLWDRALRSGEWPGYPREPQSIGPEGWAMREVESRLAMDDLRQP